MLRSIYILLLKLHPALFRQRFGDEMLDIFDSCGGSIVLIGDGFMSLTRQWVLRPDFRQPLAPVPSGVPRFRMIDPYKPRPSALLNGALMAVASLFLVATAINHGGKARGFLIGTHYPSPHLLTVARASVAEADLNTTIKFSPEAEDPWRALATNYFKIIRVLEALDADQDLTISPREMLTAPEALAKLDTDHDGKLSPEECGFFMGGVNLPPIVIERARLAFMRENPVLAALDSDHDGEISAAEVANSAVALKTLDKNGDGSLTPNELIPQQSAPAMMIRLLIQLDANRDGVISSAEWENSDPATQELLQRADRNHDGVVTQQELNAEIGLRARKAAGIK